MGSMTVHLVEEFEAFFVDGVQVVQLQPGDQGVPDPLGAQAEGGIAPQKDAELQGGERRDVALDNGRILAHHGLAGRERKRCQAPQAGGQAGHRQ